MYVAVYSVAGDDQAERGRVQGRRAVGVGVAQLDRVQRLAFQFDHVALAERFGDQVGLGELPGESRRPESIEPARAVLGGHELHHSRRRDEPGVREAFEDGRGAEEVVAMRVSDEDRRHVLAGGNHPVGQGAGFVDGHRQVDQHRVTLAVDQRGRGRGSYPARLARRQVVGHRQLGRRHIHGVLEVCHFRSSNPRFGRSSFSGWEILRPRGRLAAPLGRPPATRYVITALPTRGSRLNQSSRAAIYGIADPSFAVAHRPARWVRADIDADDDVIRPLLATAGIYIYRDDTQRDRNVGIVLGGIRPPRRHARKPLSNPPAPAERRNSSNSSNPQCDDHIIAGATDTRARRPPLGQRWPSQPEPRFGSLLCPAGATPPGVSRSTCGIGWRGFELGSRCLCSWCVGWNAAGRRVDG